MVELGEFVAAFAAAVQAVDSRKPQAFNTRTGTPFLPGLGPHSETSTVKLVAEELGKRSELQFGSISVSVSYPSQPRLKCDLTINGDTPDGWAVEVKMLRLMGDNGKLNDNILMHVLSPYPAHRSALTDCEKLANSSFLCRTAVVIYGFDHGDWPLEPAVEAFETLARHRWPMGERMFAPFSGLIHPVHSSGAVFGWELVR
jgi:hypothetical protein